MAADPADQFCVAEERSGHCAVVDGNFLYVWGGYVSIEENEVYLPSDELWIYDMDSGLWQVAPFTLNYSPKLIFVTDLQGKAFREVAGVKQQVFNVNTEGQCWQINSRKHEPC